MSAHNLKSDSKFPLMWNHERFMFNLTWVTLGYTTLIGSLENGSCFYSFRSNCDISAVLRPPIYIPYLVPTSWNWAAEILTVSPQTPRDP
jgi:hypothetical protein